MKKLFSLISLFSFLFLYNLGFAQQGTIRGTVIEDATGEPLIGVNILVKGTARGISTDIDGKFSLKLEAGSYDLRISYISFQTKTIEGVEVTADEVNLLGSIRLAGKNTELEEVVVTAEALNDTEAALITKKKKAPNLIDGISSELINQSGISKATGALKKVTGVSVQDGKYVVVRGLGDRYTNTMLNEVEIPSLDPNKNSLQLDIFPANLIDNIVVSKTAVAEMPADFTGGIVNIETKAFPEQPIFDISVSVDYNPSMHLNDGFLTYPGSDTDFLGFDNGARDFPDGAQDGNIPTPINDATDEEVNRFVNNFNPTLGPTQTTNTPDYSLGLSLGNQFQVGGNNSLGYIFSGSYKNSTKHYENYQLGEYQTPVGSNEFDLVTATRQNGVVSESDILLSGLAGLAFKTGTSKFKLTGMRLQNGEARSSNLVIQNSEDAPGQSGYTGDAFNLQYGERSITNFLLSGFHFFDSSNWEIDWRAATTFSSTDDPDLRRTTFTRSVSGGAPRFNAGAGGFPSRISRFLDEVNYVGRVNITKSYELFGETSKFKFGGSYVYKQRDYEILQYNLNFFGNQPEYTGDPNEVLENGDIFGNGNGGVIFYQSANPSPNPNAYKSNSRNTAFYISNEFTPFPNFKANLGLRAENFVLRHTGRDIQFAQGGQGNNLDNEKVLDNLDFFPSANLTYFLSDNMNLRASYSRTIARPSFKELSFAQILDPISDRIFNGGLFAIGSWDGNLSETRISNFDLRWEMFFNRGQLLSASFFYKTFDDPIELVRIRAQQTSSEFQPRNVGSAEVFGAEFEIRKSLGFISSAFKNIGFNGNLTLIQSITDITDEELQARLEREKEGQDIDDTRELAGQAPFLINAGLTYQRPDLGLDAGFFYNVRGETLIRVGGGIFPDVYSEPFHSLNFNLNKSLVRASLSLSVDNLLNDTNEELYQSFRSDKEVFSSFKPQRSVSLGFKYSF